MRVRILTSRDGHPCGAEVDIDDARAKELIGAGDAEVVAVASAVETATAATPETAMRETAQRKK